MKDIDIMTDFVRDLLDMNAIPVHIITLPAGDLNWMDLGFRKAVFQTDDYSERLGRMLENLAPGKLYHAEDCFECHYALLQLSEDGEIIVCGPVTFERFQGARLEKLLSSLGVPAGLHDQFRDYYLHVTFATNPPFFMSIFQLMAERVYGKDNYEFVEIRIDEPDRQLGFCEGYFRIPEQPVISLRMVEERYRLERELLTAVKNGNETQAMEELAKISAHYMPSRLMDSLRDGKDYCIALNTLLRKVAETAGVHPLHIDRMSNQHITAIERLNSTDQCGAYLNTVIMDYCQLVRTHNLSHYSPMIRRAVTCISTDLCADLSLHTLADRLAVNASYLSTTFKKEVGLSLTEYVNRSRIQYAQGLLTFTDLPIKDIAGQCGVPDIYYFCRLFKRITGSTPGAYRSRNSCDVLYDSYVERAPEE